MRRSFNKTFFAMLGMLANLFKRKRPAETNFTKKKVSLGKNMYQPLHQVVAMGGAIPIPHRVLNQRQKRRDARRANRRVA